MRYLIPAALISFLLALAITIQFRPAPLEERIVHLQLEQALPEQAGELAAESPELQALFLMYADDPLLPGKARAALLRYPEPARQVLLAYGDDPDFQEILRQYGEDTILPIHYFMQNEVMTLEWFRRIGEAARSAMHTVQGWWAGARPEAQLARDNLSPEQRGRYAILFVQEEGHDFLGQFVVSGAGDVAWVQTERVLEGLNQFFAGGVKGLETRIRKDQPVAASDIGWAAVDVAVGVSAFKLLRAGRGAAAGTRALTVPERSAMLGAGLWRGSAIGGRLVKYGAPAVLAYMAVRHPSLINSLLAEVAERYEIPVPVAQLVGWTLVLLPVMLILRLLLGPAVALLEAAVRLLKWARRAWGGRPRARGV